MGTQYLVPETPTRTGYVFTGWDPNINESITSNTTFIANWATNAYTVSFNLNGGTGSIPNQSVSGGDKVTIPDNPTRPGYTFLGWSPNINNPINSNTTFTAQWLAQSYTVSFDLNEGSGTAPTQHVHNAALVTIPDNPTREGYTFNGWNTNAAGTGTNYASGATYTANAAVTLYAKWTINKYTVSFNANGGSGAPAAQTKTYGTNLTLTTAKPTRTYYTFAGWNTNAAGTGTNYASGGTYSTNGGATLYAKWTPTSQIVSKVHSTRKSGTAGGTPYDYQVNVTYTATYSGPTLTTLNVPATMERIGSNMFYNNYTTDASSPKFTVTVNGTTYSYKWNYDFRTPSTNKIRTIRGATNYTVNACVNSFSYTESDGNFGTFSGSVTIGQKINTHFVGVLFLNYNN